MEKKYNHQQTEQNNNKKWIEKKYFSNITYSKKPFSILLPPPNVTGKLHLGHAWDNYIQDTIIRYKKLKNFDVLWIPGMDHAGIATQAKVEEKLQKENVNKFELGRENFLKEVWKWKDEYAKSIEKQWGKMGLALNYDKTRFTMDEEISQVVKDVFVKMFQDGLIYKGTRGINWDPKLKTVLSNIEVDSKETKQTMYYLNYKLKEHDNKFIQIATTRPETLFSDVAIAINPLNDKMKIFKNQIAINPLTQKELPIIFSNKIELDKGTGAMKVSAHAILDIEIIQEKGLQINECIDKNGKMNNLAMEFENLDRFVARRQIVEKLKQQKVIYKEEEIVSQVGISSRTKEVVEILVQPQWFVKMEKLAKLVLDNLKSENKVSFYPKRFIKVLEHWLENIEDWCISRQLWWGHQIPVWYKENQTKVQKESPGEGWIQDEDVLDTWFSSALAPFSFLNWPNKNKDFDHFFPTSLLVTGYDIIFFWVSKMYFQSLYFTKEVPFKEVFLHGLIRDEKGFKMSKSLQNGIDPMEVIDKYGSDALRWFLLTNSKAGQDIRFSEEKMTSAWSLCNKLWNVSRYIIDILVEPENNHLTEIDKWITNKLNILEKEVSKNLDKYEFTIVGKKISKFIEEDLSSWYIELSKTLPNKKYALQILEKLLVLIHPFLPHISDHLFHLINKEELLEQSWPKINSFEKVLDIDKVIKLIKTLRSFRDENEISKKETLFYFPSIKLNEKIILMVNKLANASVLENQDAFVQVGKFSLFIKTSEKQKLLEEERLNKRQKFLLSEIKRCKSLLENPNFVKKAPQTKIALEKEKLSKFKKELKEILERKEKK